MNIFFSLLRVEQWYKNLLVFLPLVFIQYFFSFPELQRVVLAFLALCAVSSGNYIINDLFDKEKDKLHPEKRKRPLAAGLIANAFAFTTAFTLYAIALLLSGLLSCWFFLSVIALALLTLLYSYQLKKVLFLDIIMIAINFVLRIVAGALVIFPNEIIRISPWLILVPFFLALFLTTAKRRANSLFLEEGEQYNETLKQYTEQLSSFLFSLFTSLLILCYALFTLFSDFPLLFITIPVVLYAILYFYQLVERGHPVGRDLHKAFREPVLLSTFLVWCVLTFFIIYAIA